jgi:hypothetical protein
MSSNLNFATLSELPCGTRFVLVNDRVPRTNQHCAFCGAIVEKGYVRDSLTRFIYCDTQCFAGGVRLRGPVTKDCGRKVS